MAMMVQGEWFMVNGDDGNCGSWRLWFRVHGEWFMVKGMKDV